MKPAYRAMACLLVLLLSAHGLRAAEPPHLVIEAPQPLLPLAERLRGVSPLAFLPVMELVGLEHPGPPILVVLALDGSEPARLAPSWAAGYAVGRAGLVVLLPGRIPSYPYGSIEAVLEHEVAHVLIARAARGRRIPRWLDEGLAVIASRTWGAEDRVRLVWAMAGGRQVTLERMDALFQQDGASARRAYVLAAAFVRHLLQDIGPEAPRRMLALVAQEVPFEEAFTRVASMTPAEAEASFWARRTFWTGWVPPMTSSAMLWAGITLLALYAFQRRRRRAAVLRRRWEEEEGSDPWDGD